MGILDAKVAIVTGASRSIGLAIAQVFARDGPPRLTGHFPSQKANVRLRR